MILARFLGFVLGTVALASMLGASELVQAQEPQVEPKPNTPIEHIVVLMQENHSFDNYFGTYPGADGIPIGTCMPVDPADPAGSSCIEPFHIGDRSVVDLGHSNRVHEIQYNEGRMDGFVSAVRSSAQDGSVTMGYYDDRDLPFYWNIADEYVLFDRFFSSAAGGSVWNHLFWVTATAGNPEADLIPPEGFGDLPTIFDRLQERGISWKFYIQNYDPTITYRSRGLGDRGSQIVWAPLLNFDRFLDEPELFDRIVDLDEYYNDLANGTLPAVAFMVPSGASEHPPGSIQAGQRFVRGLITELMRSDAWQHSAFLWTYDDWGGWYDHVPPPQVDEWGYGFRVPTLLVSPFARRGYIDSTELDYTSILRFIEDNWDLDPLAERDAKANSIEGAFDFSQTPREPRFLSTERGAEQPVDGKRWMIYAAYSVSLVLPAVLMTWAATNGRGLRRRSSRPGHPSQPDGGEQ